jgi:hypothetical protein
MLLINHSPEVMRTWQRLSEAERAAGYQAHAALHDELIRSGEMVAAESLADVSQAKRVVLIDGRTRTEDGPGRDVAEYLAGFYLIDCDGIERAIEWAQRIPEAALGLVEVRPVR